MKSWNVYFADTDNIVRVSIYEGITKDEAARAFTLGLKYSDVDVSRILKVESLVCDWEV